jgi:uncharacterized membrane protein
MQYDDLFAEIAPVVERTGGALWMRQMTLGPAREFCLQSLSPAALPAALSPLVIQPRQVWPQ